MLFRRRMGIISVAIGLALFALYLRTPLPRIEIITLQDLQGDVWLASFGIPPIFAGLDLILGKSPAPVDQFETLCHESGEVDLECWNEIQTPS